MAIEFPVFANQIYREDSSENDNLSFVIFVVKIVVMELAGLLTTKNTKGTKKECHSLSFLCELPG